MGSLKIHPVVINTDSSLKSYNFYIIQDGKSTFLIDAGVNTDKCWQLFNDTLNENNLTIKDIDFVTLTHHHVDHIGLINRIVSEVDIPVYTHSQSLPYLRRDEDLLRKRIMFFERLFAELDGGELGEQRVQQMKKALVNNASQKVEAEVIPFQENQIVSNFEVIYTPGHSSDHVSFYHPQEHALFSGDNLFAHMNSNALTERDESNQLYPSLQKHEQTLKRLNSLSLSTVYPGHGEIITNPYEVIIERIRTIENKGKRILGKLKENQMTVGQLAREIYGNLYEKMFHFIISEVVGQLSRLQSLEKVDYVIDNGVRYYYVK